MESQQATPHEGSPGGCPPEQDLVPLAAGESVRALAGHVDGCEACQARLEWLREVIGGLRERATAENCGPVPDTEGSEDAPAADAPERIGKYKVIAALGSGGQAHAYRALHPLLERDVVVKLGKRKAASDAPHRDRLLQEGRILQRLRHPHLAGVHDLDFHEDGRPFLVLEYVEGRDLDRVARDGELTPRACPELVSKIARALAEAHRQGVVHLDIKPKNIIVEPDGTPRLIDFGIARLRDPWSERSEPHGVVTGTLEYMAPEQARGESERVGPRSDLFSLGAVLYSLFVGHGPFVGASFHETLERAQRCEFDRDLPRSKGMPRSLAKICARTLAADPRDRYATADDLARALEGLPRRRFGVAVACAAAVLCIALVGFLLLPDRSFRVEELSLWKLTSTADRARLRSGEEIRPGDRVFLKLRADRDVFAYVISEDDRGQRQIVFPDASALTTNPLERGTEHHVPGRGPREIRAWQFDAEGRRETLIVVVSKEPLEELEARAREEDRDKNLHGRDLEGVFRGIRATVSVAIEHTDEQIDRLADFIDELETLAESSEAPSGMWFRKISLFKRS